MICCEATSEDRESGIFSHFKLLEQVNVRRLPLPSTGGIIYVPYLQFTAVAVWEREQGDGSEDVHEFRITFQLPSGEELIPAEGTFEFGDHRRQRLQVHAGGNLFRAAGVFRVRCDVRRAGAEEWLSQEYWFVVADEPPVDADLPAT